MSRLGTETAFEVLARARVLEAKGKDIVHLEIGEPDFDTPAHIIAAAQDALEAGYTHYGPGAGQPELRQAVARLQKVDSRLLANMARDLKRTEPEPVPERLQWWQRD